METRNLEYEMEDLPVTFGNLNRFELFDDRRHIRSTQVESLMIALRAGKHFDTVLIVNKKNGNYRIIDGNHRYEALKQYLSDNRNVKIVVRMAVYSNLTAAEERDVYTRWSLGIKQTIDDLLNLRKSEIPVYNILVKKGFPLSTYKSVSSSNVSLGLVIKMLYASYNAESVFTARGVTRNNIISIAKEYKEKHADMIIEFFDIFREAMGGYRDNKFLRYVFCVPAFNIYILNQPMGRDELVERFEKCLTDTEIREKLHEHSREAVCQMRERIFQMGDRGKHNKLQRGVRRYHPEEGVVEIEPVKKESTQTEEKPIQFP